MATVVAEKTLGEKLQSLKKPYLYGLLILTTSIPLFSKDLQVPNKPVDPAMDFYAAISKVPEGSTIIIATDWTNSTRGESGGQFEALIRILMRRNIKFVIYSSGDPQAPQVAKDVITNINLERKLKNEREYQRWTDWISAGYFPGAEGTAVAMARNIRATFGSKKDYAATGLKPIFESPVLERIQKIEDFPLLVLVTASKTSVITIERLNNRLPMAMMVTGVMGPESLVYYSSGQIVGLSAGLKGVYDLETMMENGINVPGADGRPVVVSSKITEPVPGFPGAANKGKGTKYYPTLHFAVGLMILAVIVGNIGMILSRREAKRA